MSKANHSQNEHFTIRGRWWLPTSASGQKVAGDLCYTEGDLTLSLYGGLNEARIETPFTATPETTEFPMILGESLDGIPVTVLHSFYTDWTPDIPTLSVVPGTLTALCASRLHCGRVLEGIHLSSPDERFAKCRVEIPYLEEWLGDAPFGAEVGDGLETVRLAYVRPKNHQFEVMNMIVRLIHSVRPPALPIGNSPTIEHCTSIELEPPEAMSLDWLTSQASEIVGLLAISYGGPLLSRRFTLYRSGSGHDKGLLFYPRHTVTKRYEKTDFVIRFKHIETMFGAILENWLGASESVIRARRILLSSERRPSKFIEFRFLPLMHAAEVLSNDSPHSTIVLKAEYKDIQRRMLEGLPDGLPDELMESIKNSLGHANSRTLRRKLLGMLNELKDKTCTLFCIDKETFIKGLVDTRNHFTHYSTKQGRKLLQEADLHWATQKVALMLRLFLLVKAGIPENVLQTAINSHMRLSQERAVWRKMSEDGSVYSSMEIE